MEKQEIKNGTETRKPIIRHIKRERTDDCGIWSVSRNGNMYNNAHDYLIEKSRLGEEDWIAHMLTKDWCDMLDFIAKYLIACNEAGLETIRVKTIKRNGFL